MNFLLSRLEAEPGPGRAEAQPSWPAGFAGPAQPAPSPSLEVATCVLVFSSSGGQRLFP